MKAAVHAGGILLLSEMRNPICFRTMKTHHPLSPHLPLQGATKVSQQAALVWTGSVALGSQLQCMAHSEDQLMPT